jgi:RNA polymerase nonessential primary-like sigma factor
MMREANEAREELLAGMLAFSFDLGAPADALDEPVATSDPDVSFDDGSAGQREGESNEPEEPEQTKRLAAPEFDAETLFSTDVRLISTLSRREEDALARRIVRARNAIRRILKGAQSLNRAALANFGRGLLAPEDGFREVEVVAILSYAESALNRPGSEARTGMTCAELRGFVTGLSAALATYRALRDQMVVANLRLVILFARRHRHPRLSFLDFVQEGTLGLIRAIEKYEPNRNVKFSTYAVYWIWQQIARAADTQGALIRTPVHWNQVRRRLGRELWQGEIEDGCQRSVDAWAIENGIDRERLATMARPIQCVSTDTPLGGDDDRSIEDHLTADVLAPEDHVMQADLRERLAALVEQLPTREAEIMRRRFGLSESDSETLEAVGEHFGVSRERIRQLEERALRHLREMCTAEGLHDYLA